MTKFLKNISIFFGLLLLYFGLSTFINYIIISKVKPNIPSSRIIILGDSHTQKAINPSLFTSAYNISQLAEPYMISFWKLKKTLNYINPDTVIIGFTYHNISAFNDMKFWNEQWSSEMFNRCYSIQNFHSIHTIDIDYKEFYKVFFHQMCLYPHWNHFKFVGSFSNSYESNLSDINSVIDRHYFYKDKLLGISENEITYLDSIVDICEVNKIVPVLVSCPVHKSYFDLIPKVIIERYKNEKNKFKAKGLIVVDKTNTYYGDSFYLNSDHLNAKGAARFTDELRELLK